MAWFRSSSQAIQIFMRAWAFQELSEIFLGKNQPFRDFNRRNIFLDIQPRVPYNLFNVNLNQMEIDQF